jgi:AraC-like DNA-binding protein
MGWYNVSFSSLVDAVVLLPHFPTAIAFVHVAARLPPPSLGRLRAVLGSDDELIVVGDWAELHRVLRTQPIDLMVLDPDSGEGGPGPHDESEPSPLLTLLTEFRTVPSILYATYTRDGLRAVLPLARSGAYQVVFRGFDDTRERLRSLLDEVAASLLGERLLAVILPRLTAVGAPEEVVQAVARLYRAPQAFRTVHQLAAIAGRQRGQLDRWMLKAGLAPTKVVMLAARVSWTHHYLRAPGNRFKTLALRLGYPDTVGLGRHVKWMTGMTPSQLRRGVSADQLLAILLQRVVRRPRSAHGL